MICPSCATANDEQDRFCASCRAPLPVSPAGGRPQPQATDPAILGGRFQVIRSLGKGGMGEILLATDIKLGRKVAIKSISADALRDCDSKARFLREAQAASRLDHANICTIYEIAEEDDREFIVMQHIDGVTLDQLMKLKPLSLDQVVDIAAQIADGMAAAQARHIVHRDIKPGNIMIDRSGQVKILDFGLAKICAEPGQGEYDADAERRDRDLTEKGIVLGTVAYMSPEQAKGLKLDSRSDIFSYGVVLYEMLENRNPFSESENIVTLYNILHRDVQFSRAAPDALRHIIRRAMEKDRGRRYGDFNEIRKDLATLKADLTMARTLNTKKETEIIDVREQVALLRESDPQRPASDNEHLSEMVRRLKNMKASTEALPPSGRRRRWLITAALLLPATAVVLWLAFQRPARSTGDQGPAQPPASHVLLYPFENGTPDPRVGAEIDFLLQEALSQSPGFNVLTEATVRELEGGGPIAPGQLPALQDKYGIRWTLKGKLSSVDDKFNIEASFSRLGARESRAPFFIPGKGKDSLLTDQVDNLARRVQQSVGGADNAEPAPLAAMFGGDWQAFDLYYQGMIHWDKKQFGAARRFLLHADTLAGGLPAARYHLALLADFTGNAREALAHVQALTPLLPRFSLPLRLKVQALKAKFDFAFQEQVRCLRELKGMFPFAKETIFELGEAYFRHGDAARAIPEYDAALALDRNYPAALNHLGYCYSYLGRHLQAIECFERYRDIDRTANSFDSLGDGYFYRGDYTQSENSKVYAVSLDNSMDWPYLTIADIAILRADFSEAKKNLLTYQKLTSYPKAQADALAKEAFMHYLEGDHAVALGLLDQALRRHDSTSISEHSAESHWLIGLCRIAQGDLRAATRELRWLQGLRDTYRLTAGNFDAALKFCLHLEARLAEAEQRPEKAAAFFQTLLMMKTQLSFWITYYCYPFFQNEYAEFLLRRSDLPAARLAVDQCLAFNPDYPPALWTRASLMKAQGDSGYRDVLRRIAAIYGPGNDRNHWRERLKAELMK